MLNSEVYLKFYYARLLEHADIYRSQLQGNSAGTITDLLIYGLPFALVFSVYLNLTQAFDWLVHKTLDGLCDEYYEKYPTEEEQKKRCYTLVKSCEASCDEGDT
jgi:hypothetical protein